MTKPRRNVGATEPARTPAQRRPSVPVVDGNTAAQPRRRTSRAARQRALTRKQEEIWEKATAFCAWNLPTLWTAGEPRRRKNRQWVVPIILRYLDGYEGNLGEMLFDEKRQEFTLLTDKAALAARAQLMASSRRPHGENAPPSEAGT